MWGRQKHIGIIVLLFGGMNSQNNPAITIHPSKASYVSKLRKVARLHCQAKNADSIQWKCNGKIQRRKQKIKQQQQPTDSINNGSINLVNSSFNVKYSKLENYLGFDDYFCTCLAFGTDNATVESERAVVYETYLNKRFLAAPKSGNVMLGEPSLLKCKPPYGKPEPTVIWYKNGLPISNFTEKYRLIESTNLMIKNTSLLDGANYSCIATNLSDKKRTATARIFVNWWSDWGPWSACNEILASCDKNPVQQSRHRVCSSSNSNLQAGPVKTKNSDTCSPDTSSETQLCPCRDTTTTKDPEVRVLKTGKWSKWSDWSECNKNSCTQSRHRKCVNKRAGENEILESMSCESGSPLDYRNCRICSTGNEIILGDLEHESHRNRGFSISAVFKDFIKNAEETAVIWYLSFGIMCAVLVTIVIFGCLWCCKKRDIKSLSSTEQPDKQTEYNGTVPARNFISDYRLGENQNQVHSDQATRNQITRNPGNRYSGIGNSTQSSNPENWNQQALYQYHNRQFVQPMYQQITNHCLQESQGLQLNFLHDNSVNQNSPTNTQSSACVNEEVLSHDLQRQALLYRNLDH